MNETSKRALLAVIAVLAVAAAVFAGMNFFKGEQPEVIKRIEGDPAKSMKRREMEAQQRGTAVGESIANGGAVQGERDLGGNLAGGQ